MSCPDEPQKPNNRPGLPALAYRIGDYATFRQRLLSRLICPLTTPDQPQGISLAQLTTRTNDDPAIALLDACAVVADVLTFYQERIANEGFLQTATERRSVLELARMLGYELNPGVAASTMLAFSVDDAPGSPTVVTVPKGTQIMSVPDGEELPQTFETSEEFIARVEWNALQPRSSRPQQIGPGTQQLYLNGTSTQLQAGDRVLLVGGDAQERDIYLLTLAAVEVQPAFGHTLIRWQDQIPAAIAKPVRNPIVLAFRQRANLFGHNAPNWQEMPTETKQANGGTVKGGIVRSPSQGDQWLLGNAGLPNVDILCLVAKDNWLLVGTAGRGVFRSKDKGVSWEASNTGLTNLTVQTLYLDRETNALFAGTPDGGLFRSKDDGENWVPIHLGTVRVEKQGDGNFQTINTGLPNTVVRSALVYTTKIISTQAGIGRISADGSSIKGENTKFSAQLKKGDTISVNEVSDGETIIIAAQTRQVISVNSDIDLTIEGNFESASLNPGTKFYANTTKIIQDQDIQQIELVETTKGTISSYGKKVRGKNTEFEVLQTGQDASITVTSSNSTASETRKIIDVSDSFSLTIESPFKRSVLDPGTPFSVSTTDTIHYLLVGTDDGLYRSQDEGKNWKPFGLSGRAIYALTLAKGSTNQDTYLLAGTDQGVYYLNNSSGSWEPAQTGGLTDTHIQALIVGTSGKLFAGTPTGLFQFDKPTASNLQSGSWTAIESSKISNVQALAVSPTKRIFVGTAAGIYRSDTNETNWQASNGQDPAALSTRVVSTLNVTSLAVSSSSEETVFAGSRFAGFFESDWPGFTLAAELIDLDTEYAKILEDSWVLLLKGDRFEAQEIKSVSTIPLTQFLISSKVTRLEPKSPLVKPTEFDRRSTIVLAQSEVLPLSDEILTVPVQQGNIFFDPIWQNQIFLSQYIAGLQPQKQVIISGKRIRAEMQGMGGAFRTVDVDRQTWQRTNAGLTNTAITCLTTSIKLPLGQLIPNLAVITGNKTTFTQQLKVGVKITVQNETKTIIRIDSDTSLIVDSPFVNLISENTNFKYEGMGTGTIASDRTTVTGTGTRFTQELTPGGYLIAAGETRQIETIDSDTSLTLSSAFGKNLSTGTPFTYGGTGQGTIMSDRTAIAGQGTAFTRELKVDQPIVVNGQTRIITRIDSDQALFINEPFTTNLSKPIAFQSHDLFVGTAGGGVFRSTDNGKTWEAINQRLGNLDIQALAMNAQKTAEEGRLFAATPKGLFQLMQDTLHPDGFWQALTVSVVHPDIQAIVVRPDGTLFAGTLHGGVFQSSDNGKIWAQTPLNQTDVQALAIAADGKGIFAGTQSDGVFYSPDGSSWQPINVGLTNPNVTTLVTYTRSNQTHVIAGTAGSGLFHLKFDSQSDPQSDSQPDSPAKSIDPSTWKWEPSQVNPTDLTIRSLAVNPDNQHLFAGTASGGIFRSVDDAVLWVPINDGLTSLNAKLNPAAKVNTDLRAIAVLQDQIFAAGIGLLFSPDGLNAVPMQVGDRLHLLAPPEPLQAAVQKWQLQDRNGFVGVLITTAPTDIRLEPATAEDAIISERATILEPPLEQQQPILKLIDAIQNSYDPATVSIYANVVKATHGETIEEVLGSGDGTTTHQQFLLQKPPLTYVSAATASGSASTLQVRVNQVLWQEVSSLYQRSAEEPAYSVRIEEDGTTIVTFGDGQSGARLPTGQENIVATYRSGIGLAGQVSAGSLTLLKTRPLGISEVVNPLPATGAAEPEAMSEARASAPLTVRTMGRIVSLQDYEDFARAFAGIGKAQAVQLWTGQTQQVQITVAAIDGAAVEPDSALYDNLVKAIDAARDPVQQVQVDSYERLLFNLEAKLLIDPRYLADQVIATVRAALLTKFTFVRRDFGQAVTASEVIATIQAVEGMIAVDLDALYRRDLTRSSEQTLPAFPARWDRQKRQILPAQLLLLNRAGITLRAEATR